MRLLPQLLTLLALVPVLVTAAPAPKPKSLVQEQRGMPHMLKWQLDHLVEGESLARIVVRAVEVYDPTAKAWKACAFDGRVWNAPGGSEGWRIRLTGTVEEQVGKVGQEWAPAPGDNLFATTVWCLPSVPRVKNYADSTELNGSDFVVEAWGRDETELKPYPDPFEWFGRVDVRLTLMQYGPCDGRRALAATGELKAVIRYRSK